MSDFTWIVVAICMAAIALLFSGYVIIMIAELYQDIAKALSRRKKRRDD